MLDLSLPEPNSSLPNLLNPTAIINQSLSPNSTRVILVRHGRSTYNEQGRYQGCSDESVLTEKGKKTAYQIGRVLQSIDIDIIYSSPLKRVRETTQQIINARNSFKVSIPPLIFTDKLKEINLAHWQGSFYQDIQDNYAEEYWFWKKYPHQFKLLDPETNREYFPVIDLYQKAQQFWQEILPQAQGKTILIVSHGGTNRALINTAIATEPDNNVRLRKVVGLEKQGSRGRRNYAYPNSIAEPAHYHYLQQCNCGISILEFNHSATKQVKLKALNLTTHLGKTLPKLKEGKKGLRLLLVSANLSSQELQQLAEFWQQESIDFIFSNTWEYSAIFAQYLFPNRSQILHIQVLDRDFITVWQQQIRSEKIRTYFKTEQSLITGLVIAEQANINEIMHQVSGSYAQTFAHNCLSIIHYPDLNKHPIIQGVVSSITVA